MGNDCCCKDTAACFENDERYAKKPSDGNKDILLDFRAKKLGIPKGALKKGDYIRVKVINYNPLLYKVNVDNIDSSVTQPNDTGFLGMFLSPDKFSSAVANLISPLTTVTAPKVAKNSTKGKAPFKETKDQTESYQSENVDSTKNRKKGPDEIVTPLLNRYINYDTIKKREILQLRKDAELKLEELSKEFAELQSMYLDCSKLIDTVIRRKANSYQIEFKELLMRSRAISQQLSDTTTQFKFNLAEYTGFINNNPWFKIRYAFIDTFYKIATAELANIDTAISHKKITEMYAAFIKLTQNSNCYTSLPIYINSDVKVFNISLKPVDEKSNLPVYQTSFVIPDYQKRVWGISGGINLTGLHNEIYSNRQKENDTTYNLVKDKQGKVQLGVNALAYIGWQLKNSSPDYLGVSFGAGMSLESKPKPRVLLGISFIAGEKNRIGISAGFIGGFVSQLSDAFSTTVDYAKPAENYQKDIMKMSGFISINYSFLSK